MHRMRSNDVLIVIVAAVLIAAALGVALALTPRPSPAPSAPRTGAIDGGDGVGDPYFPDLGGAGIDVEAYDVRLTWTPDDRTLTGSTTVRFQALMDIDIIHLDLSLTASRVHAGGADLWFAQDGIDLAIQLPERLSAKEVGEIVVDYAGKPEDYSTAEGARVPESVTDELLLAGEPTIAPAFFPSNDHPSDPALFGIDITVPEGMEAISVGALASRDTDDDPATATWSWRLEEPAATYLVFLAIDQFLVETDEWNGLEGVYAVAEDLPNPERAMAALRQTPERLDRLAQTYGPYPFSQFGGIVARSYVGWAALECQTRPVYAGLAMGTGDQQMDEMLLLHELAHMWFGDSVTLAQWDDIVLNEAFASHAQWHHATDASPTSRLQEVWEAGIETPGDPGGPFSPPIDDPGAEAMFTDVYSRGPAALEALRTVVGPTSYDAAIREWAQTPGPREYAELQPFLQERTGRDLERFFDAWFEADEAPPQTAEFGWPGQ